MNREFHFSAESIRRLPKPEKGMFTYRDTKEHGLSLYITANGVVTFFVRKRIGGRDERVILGKFPETSIKNARDEAILVRGEASKGISRNQERQKIRQEITFRELFDEYMERYSKVNKISWRYDEREIPKFCKLWFNRKISTITKQDVQRLHEKIRDDNGLYQANRMLERIRAMFNKAINWGWEGINPASGIKKFREKSRDRFVKPSELPNFLAAIEKERIFSPVAADYIFLSLLTGARKSNVLSMRWEEIDTEQRVWRILKTKNGDSLTVPLTARALETLNKRKIESSENELKNGWVFPSASSSSGHLSDPKKAWKRILGYAGIQDLRIHDIRRTFGSYQAMSGASLLLVGKSLGHKSQAATQIYSRLHDDFVRVAVENGEAAIFSILAKDGK